MALTKKLFTNKYFLAGLVALIAFTVYCFTVCPTIYLEDSAEFVTASYSMGIPHPPGFPLFVILGKIFITLIPFGEIAFRVNLVSAVFAALTVFLLFLIIVKITRNKIAAFSASLIMAFSQLFWSQSIVAEVYTLNTFFTLLIIYLLILWKESKDKKYLLYFALFFGLGMTNHLYLMGILAPFCLVYIFIVNKKIFLDWRLIIKILLLLLIGLSIYLYLPIRSMADPFVDWGNTETWQNFWDHLTYEDYSHRGGLGFDFSTAKSYFAVAFFARIGQQFTLLLIPMILLGVYYIYIKKRNKSLTLLLVLIFLFTNSVFFNVISISQYTRANELILRVFDIAAHLTLAILIGFGFAYLLELIGKKRKLIYWTVVILIITSPVYFLLNNYQINDLHDFDLNYQFGYKLLSSLEPNAVFIYGMQKDSETFSLLYFYEVENIRPDVAIIGSTYFGLPADIRDKLQIREITEEERRNIIHNTALNIDYNDIFLTANRQRYSAIVDALSVGGWVTRPIYLFIPIDEPNREDVFSKIYLRSNGLAYKVYFNEEETRQADNWQPVELDINPNWYLDPYHGQQVVKNNQYALASYYFERDQKDMGTNYLVEAINSDFTPFSIEYVATTNHIKMLEEQKQQSLLEFKEPEQWISD